VRISQSPMLPEINDCSHAQADRADWRAPMPPFAGGEDADLVTGLDDWINAARSPRLMSKWAILAFLRAIRIEFPDGGFSANRHDDQNAIALRVGYAVGSARLSMARRVMQALTDAESELATSVARPNPSGGVS
jgi:hypothetical protein